jgi:ribosomal protein S2
MGDTDSSPTEVDFVSPVNDDAASSIELILGKIGEAVEEGKKIKKSVK